jgi:DNA-binding PadR family transcriptional regulator
LYPLLRRLEKQGLLTCDWDTEGGRPRKYYRTSDLGTEVLGTLAGEWTRLDDSVTAILQRGEPS